MTASVVLVHGGLWEPMDAAAFWGTTGITDGLSAALAPDGIEVLAPDRPQRARTWDVEVAVLGEQLAKRSGPVRIVGASNGCTVAVLLALRFPGLVDRLLLAWPATGDDAAANERAHAGLVHRGCPPAAADELLAGGILRGVTDEQVTSLTRIRVAVLPSVPENPSHQRKTVDALLRSIRGSRELAGCPEPPTPAFRTKNDPPYLDQLLRTIVGFVN
ncbi:alpha/beta fold hydrolase [Kribbella speibonae]|uniref:Alpha/beta fold hydrolase n=1 Tax=Kribbella speibonae TaxID=1572660 RepID=A0ABY1ZX82_9ACTN|nr:alpha/beta fold hydrolase [Kribbella speibonae]TCC16639.1 alpha/beta fold hydrolase [Kribbella speibonae]